jgi:phosphate transport system substrate-binding protein
MRSATLVLALLFSLDLAAQPELKIASGITPTQNVFSRIQGSFEKASGIKLTLLDARSPAAWAQLDKGEVDAAAAGLSWPAWKQSIAATKGLRLPQDSEVTLVQIATDQIQVLTHAGTLLLELSQDELKAIFSGRVTNWKALGGDDAPIILLLDPSQIATNDTFRAQILGQEPFGPSTWTAPKGTTLLQAVAATPHAIGFAPKASQESLKVNSPMTPEVARPILLLVKGPKPSANVQKLLDYLKSDEGKKFIVR